MKFLHSKEEKRKDLRKAADWEELADKKSLEDRNDEDFYIRAKCEMVIKYKLQVEEQRKEYQAVISYLNDIQKLRLIPADSKKKMIEYARQIQKLTEERKHYQTGKHSFYEKQYEIFEEYGESVSKEVRSMCEKEAYQKVLLKDMRQLEAEKEVIQYELNEIGSKKRQLKHTGILCAWLSAGLFLLFFIMQYTIETSLWVPIILTVSLAAALAVYIMNELIRLKKEYLYEDRKLEKAITLLNKVKIKYVNNKSALQCSYEKFLVPSSTRLTELWEEYTKEKNSKERYQKNTAYLNYYNECLIEEMSDFQVEDPEVWVYQVEALLDESKMTEMDQRLQQRRKTLQETIQQAKENEQNGIKEIQAILKRRKDVRHILDKYDLTEQVSLNSIDTIE